MTGTGRRVPNGTSVHKRPESMAIETSTSHIEQDDQIQSPNDHHHGMGLDQAYIEERAPSQETAQIERNHPSRDYQQGQSADEYFTSQQFLDWLHDSQDRRIIEHAAWQSHQIAEWQNYALRKKAELKEVLEKHSIVSDKKDKSAREYDKLKEDFKKLQTDALSTIDRFQPATDSEISKCLDPVTNGIKSIVNRMAQMKPSLPEEEWKHTIAELMHPQSFNLLSGEPWASDKAIRKMVLKNVLWTFFDNQVLGQVFGGYGGETAHYLRRTYLSLYPDPRDDKDSTKWRSMTASKLATMQSTEDASKLEEAIHTAFGELIADKLGYDKKDSKLDNKLRETIAKAAAFSRLISQQRAIFELDFPDVESAGVIKHDAESNLTNLDDDEDEVEKSGLVWFVSRPGLVKWGNGQGDRLDCSMTVVKVNVQLAK